MISRCGLLCSECEAYIATQANDQAALEQVAAQWRVQYNAPTIAAKTVVCDGCTVVAGRHCGHWHECDIQACASERAVLNCAHCDEYACEKLERFLGFVPAARGELDEVRRPI